MTTTHTSWTGLLSLPTLVSVSLALCFVMQLSDVSVAATGHSDHGGVAMGYINVCDDTKTQIAIDWDPSSTKEYTCDDGRVIQGEVRSEISCENKTKSPIHVCYPTVIHYDDVPPTSGRHRPNWADFGEYLYVPPQRWLHNLEHGAIVMLYDPCADPDQVSTLRSIVTGCLRKHIITPSKLLPQGAPFALLSWGCKLLMGQVDEAVALGFIMEHAKKDGPEGFLSRPGRYNQSLIVPARIVSDFDDSVVCPNSQVEGGVRPSLGPGSSLGNLDLSPRGEVNPIIAQSLQRRQQLKLHAEKLRKAYERLQLALDQHLLH